ncbi:MAG: tetratricopeptide repeat protein [Candidatus Kapabacteria bacterium]|nr:tetratricopeptide repeat protein [Candidatus Kapabacteria bacterium]
MTWSVLKMRGSRKARAKVTIPCILFPRHRLRQYVCRMGRTKQVRAASATILDKLGASPAAFIAIAIVAIIVFAKATEFGYDKFDEDLILQQNITYLVKDASLTDVVLRDAFFRTPGKIFYRPVQNVSFFIDATIGGGKASTFYVTNILLHAIASCLLFVALRRLIGRADVSVATALLFAGSPLFAQAIAWTPGRGDLLLTVFSLLALLNYLTYMQAGTTSSLVLLAVTFLLTVFSKETGIVLVVLLPLTWLLLNGRNGQTIKRLVTTSAVTIAIAAAMLYVRSLINTDPPTYNSFDPANFLQNLRVFPEIIAKFFAPNLLQPMAGYTLVATVGGGVIMIGLVLAALRSGMANAWQLVAAGVAWYALFMLPGSMYTHRFGAMAYDYLEHRGYASLVGMMVVIALGLANALRTFPPRIVTNLIMLSIVANGAFAFRYIEHYRTQETFYNRVIESNPASGLARTNRGQIRQVANDIDGAIADYNAVIAQYPNFALPHIVLGGIYLNRNRQDSAIAHFRRSLAIDSSITQPYLLLGHAYLGMNAADSASYWYRKAYVNDPTNVDAPLNLGVLESRIGNWSNALVLFSAAIDRDRKNGTSWFNRGVAYQQLGRMSDACSDWQQAQSLGSAEATKLLMANCK